MNPDTFNELRALADDQGLVLLNPVGTDRYKVRKRGARGKPVDLIDTDGLDAVRDFIQASADTNGHSPPGGVTESTPGQTPAVAEALNKATASVGKFPTPDAAFWADPPVHPAAALLPMMDDTALDDLARDIDANGLNEPIVLWHDAGSLCLLDGRNRLAALKRLGITNPETVRSALAVIAGQAVPARTTVVIIDGVDPTTYVLSANVHRRHLNSEQKRAALAAYLKADPTVSDRTVAKELGVDHKTVGARRKDLEARGDIPHAETRTDSKGRKQPASKPARPAEPVDEATDDLAQANTPHELDEPDEPATAESTDITPTFEPDDDATETTRDDIMLDWELTLRPDQILDGYVSVEFDGDPPRVTPCVIALEAKRLDARITPLVAEDLAYHVRAALPILETLLSQLDKRAASR
jgi:ParB-like chromosome segregation protein Spo0J